jgi:hypothetical protein
MTELEVFRKEERPARWVEHSDTHQFEFTETMGFATGSTHPTSSERCKPSYTTWNCWSIPLWFPRGEAKDVGRKHLTDREATNA